MDTVTMVKISNHDFYKAIKNYLHNDLGLSSKIDDQYINETIEKMVQTRVDRIFANTVEIHRIIERKIAEVIKTGAFNNSYERQSFNAIVVGEIRRAVRDRITEKLTVKVALDGELLDDSPPKEEAL